VSVLDFSGVPSEAADVAIGAVLTLLFEVAVACPPEKGIGRARPVWIVLEEAHRFIGEKVGTTAGAAKVAAERIAREGRKYGLGLLVVSQRPAELSETALSQCGTIISMRLSNPGDQSRVKAALPDTVANLAEALPALRTGEALVTGEAVSLPTRAMIERPNPEPRASDPEFSSWLGARKANEVDYAVARWRGDRPPAAPQMEK
jgi:DNA helicase HerA-like ATPase